jgi:hypothetical protein
MPETAIIVSTPPTEVAADTAATAKALLMPEDVLVGRRTATPSTPPGKGP